MRVWQISSFGIDSLEFAERPTPEPGPGEVLVRIHAISFNFRDLMMVKGLYNPKLQAAAHPLLGWRRRSDGGGAGRDPVEAGRPRGRHLHAELAGWAAHAGQGAGRAGRRYRRYPGRICRAERKRAGADSRPPQLPGGGHPALRRGHGVERFGAADLKPGDTVLIQGTGGVSIFALQFARLRGARVLGISSSDEKLERAFDLGLDAGLNYRETPEWDRWAMEQTRRRRRPGRGSGRHRHAAALAARLAHGRNDRADGRAVGAAANHCRWQPFCTSRRASAGSMSGRGRILWK